MPGLLHISTYATWAWNSTWVVKSIALAKYSGQQIDSCFCSKFYSMPLFLMSLKRIAEAMLKLQFSI